MEKPKEKIDLAVFGSGKGRRPVVVDLFAGAGGLSLGFEQAGFDVSVAVEIDPIHASVHKYNFPYCNVLTKSALDVSGKEIQKKLKGKPVDVIVGGPPCQGFSLMGKRYLDDPRNSLVKEFIRLVSELSPSCFVFENVKGLTVGKHQEILDEIVCGFEDVGYVVLKPWRVLNAKQYGVPQSRERLFLIGMKIGLPIPNYPSPIGEMATCRDALGDLPNADDFDELIDSDEVVVDFPSGISAYADRMRCSSVDAWKFGYRRRWDERKLTSSLRTSHTDISRRRFAQTEQGCVEKVSRFFRLPEDGVCNTLRAGTDSARGAFTSPRPIHYKYARCITVREMARLHGFPDWFRFHETKWHGARQIGNSVPPPLAYSVASQIMYSLGFVPEAPSEVLDMGPDFLLRMGMSLASKYWGVHCPIAKRTLKSGNRKRSQAEVEASLKMG